MKRFFKFALVALATAAVAVACQKPEQQPEKIALKGISLNKEAVELAIGAKETLTVKYDPENATEKPKVEWSTSAPAVATVAEGEVTAVAAGEATITAKAGSFTATCKVTVKGEEQPEPGDFTSPDWANIGAVNNGNHTFKFTKDDKNAYFYTERPNDDRFGELWGDGEGYVYYAFDFDGDLTTGEELLGNGKYEYIAYIYCFGGSANAPEIKITAEGGVAPSSYSLANVMVKGSVDENGLKLEYAVPLSDLPQLPEKFTIYTWGNKSLSKVEYKYPYEAPAVPKVASWAEAEAAGAIHFFQYLSDGNWTPYPGYESVEAASFDNLTVANGVYTITLDKVCPETWNAQLFMRPNPAIATLPLKANKRYLVSLTLESSVEYSPFAKFVQYDPALTASGEPKHEGATIYEWGSVRVKANTPKTLAYVFEGVECDNVNFTLGLGGYSESTTVIIKDVKVEETDHELGLIEDDPGTVAEPWDYTPSEEYLAASNLWKAVDDANAVSFFYHYPAAGYTTVNSDTYELLSKNQSTYVLDCPVAAADGLWSNQLFMYPKEGHFIALDPAKTYKFKVTLGSNKDFAGFFKMTTYNPEHQANHAEGVALWETNYEDGFFFDGGKPVVVETELTGKEANNIVLIFAFGKNPSGCEVYIKDIIVEEVGGEVPPVVDAPESDVITVDILPTAYPSEETVVKNGDIEYNILLVANYGNGIQMKKQDSYISNKTAFKNIKTIKVTTATSKTLYPENLKLCAGTSENPTTEIPMKSGDSETAVWELDGEYTYFKLQNVSGYAVYLSKIEINPTSDPVASTPIDLSSLKANCYVISEAGAYKIPAVKGNSDESVGTVASAAIIWETLNSSTAPALNGVIAKVDAKDGFIVFETPATLTPGNALIAALDASGNILWSWHIWIPKNAISSSQFGLGGQTLMDRNLGALEVAVAGSITPESQGMLYSWGRKDPFLGNAVIGDKAPYAVAEGQASVTIGTSGVLMTVAESIKNPTTFVQTGSDDNKDWCSESDVAATLWGETKTMYDPCPAGYQVPYNPWDDAKNGIWNLKADDAILTTLGFSKNADQHWFQMGNPATVFPICGYLDQDGYKNRGARAYYWSARSTGTGIANVIRVDSSNNRVTDERKSRAGNIRCVVSE